MTPRDMLAALVVVFAWGTNFAAAKTAVHEIPPLLLTGLRFGAVAALIVPFVPSPKGKMKQILLLAFLLGAGHFGLAYVAMQKIDAATAAIVNQLTVPFSVLMAAALYRERLGWRSSFGLLLSYAGVVLLAGEPHLPDPGALVLAVLSAAAWAVANAVIKAIGSINPVTLNGWTALLGMPQLLLLSLLFEEDQWRRLGEAHWWSWACLAYTVLVASLLAYTIWYRLVARCRVNAVVPFTLLTPIFGVGAGVVVLGEPLGWHKVIGGLITLAGVAIIQIRPRGR